MQKNFRTIHLQNNLTRQKETFVPLETGLVKMYACGITVYDHCHIGHALQAIYFDVIRSYLEHAGYRVIYVRNYTDVDDKIIDKAKVLGLQAADLAQQMIASSEEDMKALGVRPPTQAPRVSEYIPQIIALVQKIIQKNAAYDNGHGDVYYRVRSNKEYGKLSGRNPDDMRSGTRDLNQGEKEDPLDFALWKKDETPGASWDSPWGKGRPGWHIECSAMSLATLGTSFDIHGGGRDLIFPHHENEIAQSESAHQCVYSKVWLHCGLLTIDRQKMSKSLGNHILIKDFLKDWPAEVLRLGFLQHHYSSNIDFGISLFQKNRARLFYYYQCLSGVEDYLQGMEAQEDLPLYKKIVEEFHTNMSDDFNTAAAIAQLNAYFKLANQILKQKRQEKFVSELMGMMLGIKECFAVLGLLQEEPKKFLETLKTSFLSQQNISKDLLDTWIQERNQARVEKNFQKADVLREKLAQLGIDIMDTPLGTQWGIKDETHAG